MFRKKSQNLSTKRVYRMFTVSSPATAGVLRAPIGNSWSDMAHTPRSPPGSPVQGHERFNFE